MPAAAIASSNTDNDAYTTGSVALVLKSRPRTSVVAAAAATNPSTTPMSGELEAAANDLREHLSRTGAKREPHADLRHALRHRKADQPVDADRGEQQRQRCEAGDQERTEARLAGRVVDDLLHGLDVADRQVRIDLRDGGLDRRRDRAAPRSVRIDRAHVRQHELRVGQIDCRSRRLRPANGAARRRQCRRRLPRRPCRSSRRLDSCRRTP